jgi:hypothetical protein
VIKPDVLRRCDQLPAKQDTNREQGRHRQPTGLKGACDTPILSRRAMAVPVTVGAVQRHTTWTNVAGA